MVVKKGDKTYTIAGLLINNKSFFPISVAVGEARTLTKMLVLPKYVVNELTKTSRRVQKILNIDNKVFDEVADVIAIITEAKLNGEDVRDALVQHGYKYELIVLKQDDEP